MSDKTVYCVVIDNCEEYEDTFHYTESIWDSQEAAVAHILNDLDFEQTTVNKRKCFMRYEDGDDIRNYGEECAYINAFTLNQGDEHAVRKQKKIPSVAGLSPDERAAYGLSVLMTMYGPDEIKCEWMCSMGPDDSITVIPYVPLVSDGEKSPCTHAIVINSHADSVDFCNNIWLLDLSGLEHKPLPKPTDELLEKVVRLTAERDRNPVYGLMGESFRYDHNYDKIAVFVGEDKNSKKLTYVISPETFECHQD